MAVGRLAWRTPTGAMLWEIWGRHRVKFLWQGAALGASAFLVYWKEHGASEAFGDLLGIASFCCFLACFVQLMACFSYLEVDARKVQPGFPGRLLLKPVGTARLVLTSMIFGGAVIVIVFALWIGLVLPRLSTIPVGNLFWISALLLSLFWWMQALAWSLPLLRLRAVVLLLVVMIHLFVLVLPQMPGTASSGWRWSILAVLLGSAVPMAWFGLKMMRQGRWEGPSPLAALWSRLRRARTRGRRKAFQSAFGAQFWLEWRRQGLVLPGVWGGIALLVVPLLLVGFKRTGVEPPPPEGLIVLLLILPLILSWAFGSAIAKFDPFQSTDEPPVYIAVRPLTNGGFLMAKLAMALAASALTWGLTVAAIFFCLAILGAGSPFTRAGLVTPLGCVSFLTGCAPALLLLVLWTWKNLLSGMGAGLTGRLWIVKLRTGCGSALVLGLSALVSAANIYPGFRETLLHWLTGVLGVCLAAKVAFSVGAFVRGVRQNAITPRAAGGIISGWVICGLFIAGYANHICSTLHQPGWWLRITLGGFLILPLADLAVAPLALAWNRHR